MLSETSSNNKRIAKNTFFLYIRMFVMMAISLYTSRIVLDTLGVEDYGIYNVVGGVVVLFSFLNAAMVSSTQRFLNFELGKNDEKEAGRVFSMSVNCQMIIIGLFLLLSETVGLWFLNNYLKIPEGRMVAANWIYQFSVVSTCFGIFYAPYNAAIVAYERMNIYAYISIFEAALNLGIVYLLLLGDFDRLIYYGVLVLAVTIIVTLIYISYCLKKFSICRYHYIKDRSLFGKLMSFSGWSLFGSVANVGANQGLGIIQNMFFGVTMNAAGGIANKVNSTLFRFVSSFVTAYNPQVVKYYAVGDRENFMRLIFKTSKFTYFLMFAISLPIAVCIDDVLGIWLKEVPAHTASFCILMIAYSLIEAITAPLWMAVQATGKIKRYQIEISAIKLSMLPITIVAFYLGAPPEFAFVAYFGIDLLMHFYRLVYLHKTIQFDVWAYTKETMFPCLAVSALALPLPLLMGLNLDGFLWMLVTMVVALLVSGILIDLLGLNTSERTKIHSMLINKFKRFS